MYLIVIDTGNQQYYMIYALLQLVQKIFTLIIVAHTVNMLYMYVINTIFLIAVLSLFNTILCGHF